MLGVGMVGALTMIGSVRAGLLLTGTALGLMLAGSCLKVMRAVIREGNVRGFAVLQAFVVACVYDVARALALVTRAPHRGAARRSAVATT